MLGGTGVGIATFLVLATNVADANGMLVVVADVGSCILLLTTLVDGAILVDDPVVTDASPALGLVHAVDVLNGYRLAGTGATAVYDDVQDILHGFH